MWSQHKRCNYKLNREEPVYARISSQTKMKNNEVHKYGCKEIAFFLLFAKIAKIQISKRFCGQENVQSQFLWFGFTAALSSKAPSCFKYSPVSSPAFPSEGAPAGVSHLNEAAYSHGACKELVSF